MEKTKIQRIKIDKEFMSNYHKLISRSTTDGDIFKIVREIENDAFDNHNVKIENSASFYWHLIEFRDNKKAG